MLLIHYRFMRIIAKHLAMSIFVGVKAGEGQKEASVASGPDVKREPAGGHERPSSSAGLELLDIFLPFEYHACSFKLRAG